MKDAAPGRVSQGGCKSGRPLQNESEAKELFSVRASDNIKPVNQPGS